MDVTHGLGKSRRSADEEGSNLDEFRTMKHGQMQAENKAKISESELKEAFRVFDSDGNDFIDWDELKYAMVGIDESVENREVDDMMSDGDKDTDWQIDFHEWLAMMKHVQ
ncbi:troponin C, body wall muscle-like isoform X2 [Styela clava]